MDDLRKDMQMYHIIIEGVIIMTIQEDTIVQPIPTDVLIAKEEDVWRIKLPMDFKEFIVTNNGGIPNEKSFHCNERNYSITRFLCILEDVKENPNGWYDISVVESIIGERLTDNEDLIGVEVLPVAELFAKDYVCLDYRENKENPFICLWSDSESGDFDPVTYKVADTFSEFIAMLK